MPGLEFRNISKSFGAVRALRDVSLTVHEGEAHALMGENGAGKSTLLKILAGILRPDEGEVRWHDAPLRLPSPRAALEHGIGLVYQEMLSFPQLSVTANIFAGRELTTRFGRLDHATMRERTVALLRELHLSIDPDSTAESLSAAHRQLLQVARALAFDCRVLVLDEPTTSLTDAETEHLFAVVERLKARGVTIVYVSHRLPEVFRLCDRITVLRDGGFVTTVDRTDVTPADIVKAMVGRDLPPRSTRAIESSTAPARLQVRGLTRRPVCHDISLSVAPGEIVGLFGLVGAGRSELLETLFGLHAADAGAVTIDDAPTMVRSVRDAVRAGLALVPEERQRQGLLFNLSIRHNLVLAQRTASGAARIGADEPSQARTLMDAWRVKAPGLDAFPDELSGGNQQKVLLARWLATAPRVLLLDEPTKGVDVGAKFEIHEMIRQQAASGTACLVASSDLPEVLALCDRVLVMREGRVRGALAGADATEAAVMALATHEAA
ncbi:MAG: sugar ABC transporter ATP-binding protein [Acidobacteria bacterium]|nr:sugar ABC transporter ATP-binding protein [Acidobacteriota bacterium]